MSYPGHVVDGHIVLDGGIVLPDGMAVRVESTTPSPAPSLDLDDDDEGEPETLAERLKEFLEFKIDLPPDAAENHDFYLYGTPKHGLPDR